MRGSTSIWSRYVARLFGPGRGRNRLRRSDFRRRDYAPVYSAAEVLEERSLLSATFGSALSIGNDTGVSLAVDVAADAAGNSYVTGDFRGTVDFDQGATHPGDSDILTARGSGDVFVAKYAPDNSLVWVQRMGGDFAIETSTSNTDIGRRITIGTSGSVYVTGEFMGSADFGSTILSSAGVRDGFVTKLDAAGTVQWARSWGTADNNDWGMGVGVDSTGNVYALGVRVDEAHDILKFSPTGSAVWSKSIATDSSFFGDLAVNASGNVFVAGSFQGTVDFDPGSKTKYVSSGPSRSGFALKLDTNGKFDWVSPFVGKTVGSTSGNAVALSVALDASGNVVVGGRYDNTVDFNPGGGTTTLPTIGGGFITKLNSSGGLVWARALESNDTVVNGLDVDTAGSIYAIGSFYGTVDLDPGAGVHSRTTAGGYDFFVVKLTAAGNFSWAETFGSTGDDIGYGIAVDSTGVVHLTGRYEGTVDFDPDPLATYNLTTPGIFRNGFRLRLRRV